MERTWRTRRPRRRLLPVQRQRQRRPRRRLRPRLRRQAHQALKGKAVLPFGAENAGKIKEDLQERAFLVGIDVRTRGRSAKGTVTAQAQAARDAASAARPAGGKGGPGPGQGGGE